MTYRKALLLTVCIVLYLVHAGAIIAQPAITAPMKNYSSERHAFSIAYPASWHIMATENRVDISFARGGFSAAGDNAGLTLMVDTLAASDDGKPDKALQRIVGEDETFLDFTSSAVRRIGGRDWLSIPYKDDAHCRTGEIRVLVKGISVYFIGSYYTSAEIRKRFQSTIEAIIESFAFTPLTYKEYRSQERGISFLHPAGIEVDDRDGEIQINVAGENVDAEGFGAFVSLGAFSAAEDELKNLDEEGVFDYMKKYFPESSSFGSPERLTLAKADWHKEEVITNNGKMTIYLKKTGTRFFGIVIIVRPITAEGEFMPIFDTFLKSLSIDFRRWGAYLNKIGEKE